MPTWTIERAPAETREHGKYNRLIAAAQARPPLKVAVVHPCDEAALGAALEAAALGIIELVFVGPRAKIVAAAAALGADISPFRLVDAAHSHEAAEKAVALVRAGEIEALMKGSLHTDELMAAVVRRDCGLRTARRLSHCFVMDVPGHATPLIVTDAAVNIAPSLEEKRDITQNAIDLARALGEETVRVYGPMSLMTSAEPAADRSMSRPNGEVPAIRWALARMEQGGITEAAIRAVLLAARLGKREKRRATAKRIRELVGREVGLLGLATGEASEVVRQQTYIVRHDPERALATLPALVRTAEERQRLLGILHRLTDAIDLAPEQWALMSEFRRLLAPELPLEAVVTPLASSSHAPGPQASRGKSQRAVP